ncbi:hypothetical protein CfE428DRAFT_4697 [Chthoniobacter flavus Ellin428]|uniref:Lipoprotein n=1 Tax=Chthoniobacter flavus Ellin428 TaxID=497964 RepID=B4D707_9BACT|nr:hypothetical protein [Chthoniobacter flavus]EDY17658.1 hypothetical protein CfE428DRAFT_4697 [Chthoniobacter flavus Ellin428]TCO84076.1 hypothetical protein EV701_1386 [Chthoniobacter flavus]
MKRVALFLVWLGMMVGHSAFASEPPPLEKSDAQRIMEAMDWTDVTVLAIRQGVDAHGATAPIYATVVGLGTFQGRHHSICQTVYYDKDLDWYFLDIHDQSARLWNKNGCQDIKPWGLW